MRDTIPLVRRLPGILLNALTALLVLLLVATVALWVRGHWREDEFGCYRPPLADAAGLGVGVRSGGGGMAAIVDSYRPGSNPQPEAGGWYWNAYPNAPVRYASNWTRSPWGFLIDSSPRDYGVLRVVVFPFWLPTALFAILPISRLALAIRRRLRRRTGHCLACGYDLRATPQRCPECGAVPRKSN